MPRSPFSNQFLVLPSPEALPVSPDVWAKKKFVVLDASGDNPAASKALATYADELHKAGNWRLAADIEDLTGTRSGCGLSQSPGPQNGDGLVLYTVVAHKRRGEYKPIRGTSVTLDTDVFIGREDADKSKLKARLFDKLKAAGEDPDCEWVFHVSSRPLSSLTS